MTFDEEHLVLFFRQVKGLPEIEITHLLIGDNFSEQIRNKPGKSPSGFTKTVIKINIKIHKNHASLSMLYRENRVISFSSAPAVPRKWL